jgi:hypothetical protein
MRKALAVIGANLKGNIGDFALLHAALTDLSRVFPEHVIDVYSQGFLDIDKERLAAFRNAVDVDFKLAGRTFSMPIRPKLVANLAKTLGLWPAIQGWVIRSLSRRKAPEAATFKEYEAVFVVGGAQWGGMRVGISMFSTLLAIAGHNAHIFSYPFSIDSNILKFNTGTDLKRYFALLSKPVLVRDSISSSVLNQAGIDHRSEVDSVFLLERQAGGICAKPGRNTDRIILCVTNTDVKSLCDLVKRMEPLGREFCLLTTCWNEDEAVYRKASSTLGAKYLAPMTWQEAVSEIKASSLLVTNRLHGLIFACLARSAALPITDRQKSRAFAADAAIPWSAASLAALSPTIMAECLSGSNRIVEAMDGYRLAALSRMLSPFGLREQ